jgi:DNA-binding MarR family transcriptional regulator
MRLSTREALDLWRRTVVETVRRDEPDLTARQLAVLLSVYLGDPPHTVRRLARDLDVAKPAVTRALDRLCALDLVRRKTDPQDARSILLQRTVRGSVFLSEFADIILRAAAQAGR